jgi:hypothetical protein
MLKHHKDYWFKFIGTIYMERNLLFNGVKSIPGSGLCPVYGDSVVTFARPQFASIRQDESRLYFSSAASIDAPRH